MNIYQSILIILALPYRAVRDLLIFASVSQITLVTTAECAVLVTTESLKRLVLFYFEKEP